MSLARALYHHARNRPTHPAVVDARTVIDYRELFARATGAAAEMRRRGLAPGDVVALSLPASADYVVALQALALLGAVALPVHAAWPLPHRSELARYFGARAVLGPESDPAIELALGPDVLEHRIEDEAPPDEAWEAPLVVSNSSGTTGAYKGVLLRHRHMLARIHARSIALGFSTHDRAMMVVEPHHSGSRNACFMALHAGATLFIRSDFAGPEELVRAFRDEAVTFTYLVPSIIRRLLAGTSGRGVLLPTLRALFCSSDRLSIEERRLVRERLCPRFYEGYATSEGGLVTLSSPEDQLRHAGAVGRPVPEVELEIVDDEHRAVPRGEVGRVRFRGPSVPDGYFRNPEATRERFQGGWFYPGDLASQNAEGYVFLKGRADDAIVRDGIKFLPADVERVLAEHPKVREVCVIGVPQPSGSAAVVAFVCTHEGGLREAELASYSAERLPPVRRPDRYEFIAELPVAELGKVSRADLRARARRLLGGT
jgi:acyl-CoA synthetase (AMP-forming)/AMP-acid ligase II